MKTLSLLVGVLAFYSGIAKADLAKDCFTTVDNTQFCSTDNLGKVQVFVFNAGWCPACNDEMDELGPMYTKQYANKAVVFASLSGEGYGEGSTPTVSFLKQWKSQHKIPFIVGGKKEDFGEAFGESQYIPFTVIIDQQGNVTKTGSLGADEISSEVDRLLGK